MYKPLTAEDYDAELLEAKQNLAIIRYENLVSHDEEIKFEPIIPPPKDEDNLEDYEPGATKAQVMEALRIISTTKVKPKSTSRKS
jgi:hypothetical protein